MTAQPPPGGGAPLLPGGGASPPPDGGAPQTGSWATITGSRIKKSDRSSKNVLEIDLESDRNSGSLSETMIGDLFSKMSLNLSDIVTMQLIPPFRPRKIFVELKEGINLSRACRNECFNLGNGFKTRHIKPKNKNYVEVTISGLDIDTPDGAVLLYLSFFGTIVKKEVIYCKHRDGLFRGMNNGDRKYQVEFSEGRNMGSYHIIDGALVLIPLSPSLVKGSHVGDARQQPLFVLWEDWLVDVRNKMDQR